MPNYSIESQYIGTERSAIVMAAGRATVMGADGLKYAEAGKEMDGIVEAAVIAGEPVRVGIDSIKDGVAGAAIARGVQVEVGVDGKFITLASGIAVGRAYTAASAEDSIFALKIK